MPTLVTEQLLDAIKYAESRGQRQPTKAVGDTQNTYPAHGAYQMTKPAYQDVQRLFPKEFGSIPFERLLESDEPFQRQAARRYLEAGQSNYGITDFNRLISFYNRGPKARTGAISNTAYVNTVRQYMKLPRFESVPEGPMPKKLKPQAALQGEEEVRRLNRLMTAAGFAPMRLPEVEKVLVRMDEVKDPHDTRPTGEMYQDLLGRGPVKPPQPFGDKMNLKLNPREYEPQMPRQNNGMPLGVLDT